MNSMFENLPKMVAYPKGYMNICPCGEVVKSPAKYHEGFPWWDNPNKCKDLFDNINK
jgi:hypothetical protein